MYWQLLSLLSAAAVCLCLSACGQSESGEVPEMMQTAPAESETETSAEQTAEELVREASAAADKREALRKLSEYNPEVYAWLEITGTDLSFPVLQSEEDEYFYLNHDLNGQEDPAGCIYTEYYNNTDFGDPNTVIYGRNVEGRFAGLHQYRDRDFFDSYREICVTMPEEIYTYRIFAAYEYDDRHLIKIYDFWDSAIFSSYLKDVYAQRGMDTYLDDSMEVTAEDKILTLSTGVTGKDDRRYLVQAVLTDGKTEG